MSLLWVAGASLAFLASCVTNAGVNTQKYSFMRNEKLHKSQQRSYLKQPLYLCGLSMVFFGSLGDFAALALAAQSIVAPMASVTLVTNVLFAHFILKEQMFRRDIIGTALIITGCILSIAFGDHSESTLDTGTINELFLGIAFLIYAVFFCVLCIILYVLVRYITPLRQQLSDAQRRYGAAVEIDDDETALQEDAHILHLSSRYKKFVKIHPFAYCSLSGILGANSILFGKMVAECIKTSITGDNQMANGYFFSYLITMIVFIVMQLHFLALGLAIFDSLYVVPVFQCFFITVSTVGGACFFLEFNTFNLTQAVIFPIGILLTLCGVYMLSMRAGVQAEEIEQRRCSVAQRSALVSRVSAARSMRGTESSVNPVTPCNKSIVFQHSKLFTESSMDDRGIIQYDGDVSVVSGNDPDLQLDQMSRQGSLGIALLQPNKYLALPLLSGSIRQLQSSSSCRDFSTLEPNTPFSPIDMQSVDRSNNTLLKTQSEHSLIVRN